LDEACQIPVITHVLGSSQIGNKIGLSKAQEAKTTNFKNVTRYNYGITAANHQQKGGAKPAAAAKPTKEEVEKSVPENTDPPTSNPRTESEQQKAISESGILGATTLSAALARNAQREFRQGIADAGFGQFLPGA
jgi:uncharacterized membrane protein